MCTIVCPNELVCNNGYKRIIPDGFTVEDFNKALDDIHGKYFELKDGDIWMVYYATDSNELQVCAENKDGVEYGFTYNYFMSMIVKQVDACF